MNWKKRYETINVGDMVQLIKYHEQCDDPSCCIGNGFTVGNTYKVTGMRDSTQNRYVLKNQCGFPEKCLVKK